MLFCVGFNSRIFVISQCLFVRVCGVTVFATFQGFTEPAIATSALAATFHTVNGWRERMTMSTHLPYYSVAADMHGMLYGILQL